MIEVERWFGVLQYTPPKKTLPIIHRSYLSKKDHRLYRHAKPVVPNPSRVHATMVAKRRCMGHDHGRWLACHYLVCIATGFVARKW